MNRKLGVFSSAATLIAVCAFLVSSLLSFESDRFLSGIFIAWGYLAMVCAFAAYAGLERKAAAYTAVAFAAAYALLVMVVYYTQLTTVQTTRLTEQAQQLLAYGQLGLFFAFEFLGYACMALSTFFIALTIRPVRWPDRLLKGLLAFHGALAAVCVAVPLFGLLAPGTPGGRLIANFALNCWCFYFAPVCGLSFWHFWQNGR